MDEPPINNPVVGENKPKPSPDLKTGPQSSLPVKERETAKGGGEVHVIRNNTVEMMPMQ